MGESNRGETHVSIAKHRNGSLETIKLKALLHIQKFVEEEKMIWPDQHLQAGSWKPIPPGGGAPRRRQWCKTVYSKRK